MNRLVKTIIPFVLIANMPVRALFREAYNEGKRRVAEKRSEELFDEINKSDPFTFMTLQASGSIEQWVTEAVNYFGVQGKIHVEIENFGSSGSAGGLHARTMRLNPEMASFIAMDIAKRDNLKLWYPWSKKNDICYLGGNAKELSSSHKFFHGSQFKSALANNYLTTASGIDCRSLTLGIIAHESGHLKALDSLSPLGGVSRSCGKIEGTVPTYLSRLVVAIGIVGGIIEAKKEDTLLSRALPVFAGAGGLLGYAVGTMLRLPAMLTGAAYLRSVEWKADANVPDNPDMLFAMYQKLNEIDLMRKELHGNSCLNSVVDYFQYHPSERERAAYYKKRFEEYIKKNPAESARFQERLKALEISIEEQQALEKKIAFFANQARLSGKIVFKKEDFLEVRDL